MAKKNEPTPGADGRKPQKTASGKSGLLTVITILWLAGLTAFAYMMMNRPEGGGDLADRVAKLESRSATVAGKITKPGADKGAAVGTAEISPEQLAGLEKRLGQLEKNLAEISGAQTGNQSGSTEAKAGPEGKGNIPASADAGFEEMKSRVDDLEARLLACGACSEKPVARKVEKAPEKALGKKSAPKKVHARSPRKITKPKKIVKRSAPASPAAARTVKAPYEHYDSVYDISMRVGPLYGHTDRDSIGYSRMAPGAAIHPSSNPAAKGSFAGSSTYYNQGIFE